MLDTITPLVLTFNEEQNIGRALANLTWAREIVVVDSGSTDQTKKLASAHANVRFVEHPFREHAEQWNFGLDEIRTEWALTLDADYMIGEEMTTEFATLSTGETWGYRATFRYAVNGRVLRGSLYPPRVVLFRVEGTRFHQDGHTQRVTEGGPIRELRSRIVHDDRKPLDRWLMNQRRYAALEADRILSGRAQPLRSNLRRGLIVTPIGIPLHLLFVKRLILDGSAGCRYALERTVAECLISLALIERRNGLKEEPRD